MINYQKLYNYIDRKNYYIDFAPGINEPGYNDQPVALANWNDIPEKLQHALEINGIDIEWSDEWITCSNCNKIFRTSPDSYNWQMAGIILDGECYCLDCLDADEYYESLHNNPRKAVTTAIARQYPPENHGYTLISDDHENGLHEGMDANPTAILKECQAANPGDYIFVMTDQSQFYITSAIYRKG